jgi:hypothetical protein
MEIERRYQEPGVLPQMQRSIEDLMKWQLAPVRGVN